MEKGEEEIVCRLVRQVFAEFVAPLYEAQGVEEFERYADPERMARRVQSNHIVLAAEAEGALIGAIEARNFNHISLLFITREWQCRGVARKLLHEALAIAKAGKPDLLAVEVYSSPNAVEAYKALGFESVGLEKLEHGIRFIPMRMRIAGFDDG